MGNAESNKGKNRDAYVPLKPALKKPAVPGPANGSNYYPAPYGPGQYLYPPYPSYFPKITNENFTPNPLYQPSQAAKVSQAAKKTTEQQTPHQHHPSDQTHHTHHHHQHSTHRRHSHHHHHHHHHQSRTPENEHVHPPSPKEHVITPHPPPPQTQMPISSVSTYKPAPPPSPVHHSPSVITKRSPPPVLIEKRPSVLVIPQHQTPQAVPSKIAPTPLPVPTNNFEKAPPMTIKYIAKSPDTHSLNNYTSGPLTVVQRRSSVNARSGNRWYDYDYDKRVKPLVLDNLN